MLGEGREVIKKEVNEWLLREAGFEGGERTFRLPCHECGHSRIEYVCKDIEDEHPLSLLYKSLHHLGVILTVEEVAAYYEEERNCSLTESHKDISRFTRERPVDGNDKECHNDPHHIDRVDTVGGSKC